MNLIAPSLLSADFARLKEEIDDVKNAGAEWLHVDVMDGRFVPNISIGLPVVKSIRKATNLVLDVHLMIIEPHLYAARFCDAGADLVSFHVEADTPENISSAIAEIHARGKKAGLVLKPATPAEAVEPWLDEVDLVLVMTVEPGFGGQAFMPDMLPKIERLAAMRAERGARFLIEADGGVNEQTAACVKAAGTDVLVAGSAVFGKADRAAAVEALR